MLIQKSFSIEGKGGYSLMKKEKTTIVVAGVLIGVIAAMLVFFGNPANMGFCIACFLRDTTGALGLHSAAAVPVSYTHLDVYKRQLLHCAPSK